MIKSIFVFGEEASVLAHTSSHRVTGLTLPSVDANTFSSDFSACLNF